MATATRARAAPALDRAVLSRALPVVALIAVCALGALLRFENFGVVYTTPYYDAAVRSMGLSFHNFLYGALDPGGQISIDKTPVDLWLQVASTKLFGFSSVSLRLPPAIAGTLALPLMYDLVRRGFGRWAGVAAALALAVLPSTVLTSRSDTMDTVMATLLLAAAWLIVRVRPERRALAVIAAGGVAGLAFEVKLFEGTVALPALGLLGWLALGGSPVRRLRTLALAGVAFLVVAASWAVVASLLPGPHPYALGSSNGQIWNAILVYNGLHRLGVAPTGATAPGLLRLFGDQAPRHFGRLIGAELVAALGFGALAVLAGARRGAPDVPGGDQRRRTIALAWGLGAWLVIGALVASFMGRLWPRYLEAFTPAVAAVLGLSVVVVGRAAARGRAGVLALGACAVVAGVAGPLTGARHGLAPVLAGAGALLALGLAGASLASSTLRPRLAAAATLVTLLAALAVPAATSVRLVRAGTGDSAGAGNMKASVLVPLSAYLRAHQGTARYELAGPSILTMASVVVRDARPVLTLGGVYGRPLVTPAQLARAARDGQVRYAVVGHVKCIAGVGAGCPPAVGWVRTHGIDVSRAAGLPRRGMLYRLPVRSGHPATKITR